jgi:hypothetical protein
MLPISARGGDAPAGETWAMTRHAVGLAMVGLVALAACSPQRGGNAASSGGPDTTISLTDLPVVKAGYWERVDTSNGQAPTTSHFCETGKPVDISPVTKNCSTFTIKRTFTGALVTDANCASGPVSTTMHMTVSGDFNASYTSDSQMTITMQGKPPQTFTLHAVSRYLGDCPANQTADG